jgi:hypothetical protein
MIRNSLLAAALVVGLAVPALAADSAGHPFTQDQARQHLIHLGYTNVSQLERDAHGNWAGVAVKDGKTVPVAVGVKPAASSTN